MLLSLFRIGGNAFFNKLVREIIPIWLRVMSDRSYLLLIWHLKARPPTHIWTQDENRELAKSSFGFLEGNGEISRFGDFMLFVPVWKKCLFQDLVQISREIEYFWMKPNVYKRRLEFTH